MKKNKALQTLHIFKIFTLLQLLVLKC